MVSSASSSPGKAFVFELGEAFVLELGQVFVFELGEARGDHSPGSLGRVKGPEVLLFWLNGLVREFWAVEGVEDGLLVGGDGGGVGLGGAVDREGR